MNEFIKQRALNDKELISAQSNFKDCHMCQWNLDCLIYNDLYDKLMICASKYGYLLDEATVFGLNHLYEVAAWDEAANLDNIAIALLRFNNNHE